MFSRFQKFIVFHLFSVFLVFLMSSHVRSQDLGRGFFDHGVTTPCSNERGIVATVDGNGRDVVLVWLFDHRGSYALLMIDAETGKSQQFSLPFPLGDAVYSSLLSSKNKFYTLFNKNFVEFDPVKRAFTFCRKAFPSDAMGMAEDDHGVIWAVTYPGSGVVSFNPDTRDFKDYGSLYQQNWAQYPRSIATDDKGYVYFGLGETAAQIVAFDPFTGKAKPILEDSERKKGSAFVYRDLDGKVYGKSSRGEDGIWYEFYKGEGHKIGKHHTVNIKPIITGDQGLCYRDFRDGKRIKVLDLLERKLVVEDTKMKTSREVSFDYASDGGWTMGVGASPDGKLCGGTSFPMRFFSFDPKTGSWQNLPAFGQFNALARQGDRIYFGSYGGGCLLEWDPSKPWVNTRKEAKTNPQFLAMATPVINRPQRVLACPDDNTIVLSGTPGYGYTGGGLLFWDRGKKNYTLVQDSAIILDQSTMSLVALPGGKILGGTTTGPGTGGEKKAKEAALYIMEIGSKKIEWHETILPGIQDYSDLCLGPDGLIYGIADFKKFFVFDPVKRKVVYLQEESGFGRTAGSQSPRIFVSGPENEVYILYFKGIVKVDPKTYKLTMIAESPVPIHTGGVYLDGRIYFISGSHLCSYKL